MRLGLSQVHMQSQLSIYRKLSVKKLCIQLPSHKITSTLNRRNLFIVASEFWHPNLCQSYYFTMLIYQFLCRYIIFAHLRWYSACGCVNKVNSLSQKHTLMSSHLTFLRAAIGCVRIEKESNMIKISPMSQKRLAAIPIIKRWISVWIQSAIFTLD